MRHVNYRHWVKCIALITVTNPSPCCEEEADSQNELSLQRSKASLRASFYILVSQMWLCFDWGWCGKKGRLTVVDVLRRAESVARDFVFAERILVCMLQLANQTFVRRNELEQKKQPTLRRSLRGDTGTKNALSIKMRFLFIVTFGQTPNKRCDIQVLSLFACMVEGEKNWVYFTVGRISVEHVYV